MHRSLKIWLQDIQNACSKIHEYQKDTTFEQLTNNQMMQDAIIFNLQIIGEACKQIPADFRDKNTSVPWKDIARLRDIIAHAYFRIDIEIVWSILKDDLPKLSKEICQILKDFDEIDQ